MLLFVFSYCKLIFVSVLATLQNVSMQHLMMHKARRIDRAKLWVPVNRDGPKSALWLILVIVHGQIREQYESALELLSRDVRVPLYGWLISANYFWSSHSALEKKRVTNSTTEWVILAELGWDTDGMKERGCKSNCCTEMQYAWISTLGEA